MYYDPYQMIMVTPDFDSPTLRSPNRLRIGSYNSIYTGTIESQWRYESTQLTVELRFNKSTFMINPVRKFVLHKHTNNTPSYIEVF